MVSPVGGGPASGSPNGGDNNDIAPRSAMKKIHFEVILERRWLATETPEAVRRALLGAFACVVGNNAGDGDVEWGLDFLRVLAAAHLALPPDAADDVEVLATGGWPEGAGPPTHCFQGGRAGEWAEEWTVRRVEKKNAAAFIAADDAACGAAAAVGTGTPTPTPTPSTSSSNNRGKGGDDKMKEDAATADTAAAAAAAADAGADDDADLYRYSSAWERCLVEILARLVTSKEYVAPARAALRRVAAAADVSWSLLTVVEDELAAMLKAARAAEEGGGGTTVGAGASSSLAEVVEPGGGGEAVGGGGGDGDDGGVGDRRGGGGDPSTSSSIGALALPAAGGDDDAGRSARSTLGKWLQVGGMATLGGVALVLTGGFAAPAVVGTIAALGATGGIIGVAAGGVAATVAAIGGTMGITIIFGASGAGLAGWKMARRTAGLTDFEFKPVRGEDTGLPVIIYAPGFHVLRHRLTHHEFTLAGISGVGEPPNIFGCWGGDTGMFKALFVDEETKIGWTLRDVEDSYGVNHAVVSKVEPGSHAEAAGVNVGAVVYELLTPEGMDWPVQCAEDAAVMMHKRPLMVYLRRCMPNPKYDDYYVAVAVARAAEEEAAEAAAAAAAAEAEEEAAAGRRRRRVSGGAASSSSSRWGHETMLIIDDMVIPIDEDSHSYSNSHLHPSLRKTKSERYHDGFRQPNTVRGTARRHATSHLLRLETGFEETSQPGSLDGGGGNGGGGGNAGGIRSRSSMHQAHDHGSGSGLAAGFFGGGDGGGGGGWGGSSSDDGGSSSSEEEGYEMSTMRPMTPSQIPSEILAEKTARNGRSALPMVRNSVGEKGKRGNGGIRGGGGSGGSGWSAGVRRWSRRHT